MRERPILFSAAMVRAILDERKTQTRRVVKPQPRDTGLTGRAQSREAILTGFPGDQDETDPRARFGAWQTGGWVAWCPYGAPGDRLWVREAWRKGQYRADVIDQRDPSFIGYRATWEGEPALKWKPSIHMPRSASRITLEVTGVRVERLQEISEADAVAEGVETLGRDIGRPAPTDAAKLRYAALWEQINGAGSWAANPWVWVVEFRRLPQ